MKDSFNGNIRATKYITLTLQEQTKRKLEDSRQHRNLSLNYNSFKINVMLKF